MVYLRTVFALISCKEASLFGVDSCSGTAVSTFYKLREIERSLLVTSSKPGVRTHVTGLGDLPLPSLTITACS